MRIITNRKLKQIKSDSYNAGYKAGIDEIIKLFSSFEKVCIYKEPVIIKSMDKGTIQNSIFNSVAIKKKLKKEK